MLTPESFEEHRSGLRDQEITGNVPPSFVGKDLSTHSLFVVVFEEDAVKTN